jgi:hypothetical protein
MADRSVCARDDDDDDDKKPYQTMFLIRYYLFSIAIYTHQKTGSVPA